MQLLRSVFAALFVVLAGAFAALVIAMSAIVVFIVGRWRGLRVSRGQSAPRTRKEAVPPGGRDEVIDVEATEVGAPPS
jgi:hypothetical protein